MSSPLVTCIVPTHLDENAGYLKLCLESLLSSKYVDFEVICLADTISPPTTRNNPRLRVYWNRELNSASKKFNEGAKLASPHSKYLWLVSDDVMVASDCMKIMVQGMGENPIICNPMSNSDQGSQFYGDVGLPLKLTKEQFSSQEELNLKSALYTMRRPFLIPVRSFVAFYCTMLPKKAWEMVGGLDDRMDARGNDVDYCLRAQQLGIHSFINLGAYALHYGDRTLPKVTTPEQYAACDQAFREKWLLNSKGQV